MSKPTHEGTLAANDLHNYLSSFRVMHDQVVAEIAADPETYKATLQRHTHLPRDVAAQHVRELLQDVAVNPPPSSTHSKTFQRIDY